MKIINCDAMKYAANGWNADGAYSLYFGLQMEPHLRDWATLPMRRTALAWHFSGRVSMVLSLFRWSRACSRGLLGWPSVLVGPGLRVFPWHRALSAKSGTVLGKLWQFVNLVCVCAYVHAHACTRVCTYVHVYLVMHTFWSLSLSPKAPLAFGANRLGV